MADGHFFIAPRTNTWPVSYLSPLELKYATKIITIALRIGKHYKDQEFG
jgi:hypothetical protein